MRTLQQLADEALAVQDACNLSGVVHGFSRAMNDLCEHTRDQGTDYRNRHPLCVLWADKINHLLGIRDFGDNSAPKITAAYAWCYAQRDSAEPIPVTVPEELTPTIHGSDLAPEA